MVFNCVEKCAVVCSVFGKNNNNNNNKTGFIFLGFIGALFD